MTDANLTPEQQQAFEAVLAAAQTFVTLWKGGLSPEREELLDIPKLTKDGWRFGVAVSAPRHRVTLQVFALNPATNETKVLQSIEQANIVQ